MENEKKKVFELTKQLHEASSILEQERERNTTQQQTLQQQTTDLQQEIALERKKRLDLQWHIQSIREENEKALRDVKIVYENNLKLLDEQKEKEYLDLREQLQESKDLVKDLFGQNKDLYKRVKEVNINSYF